MGGRPVACAPRPRWAGPLGSLRAMADQGTKLDLDWVRTLAGALAAVSSTLLLSTLGAAGTIVGAALGSVVVTVTTALYNQGLARSKEQALVRVGLARAELNRAAVQPQSSDDLAHARAELSQAEADLDGSSAAGEEAGWRERLALLPWKRIGLWTAAVFVAVIALITAFELVVGRPVSAVLGGSDSKDGTSITRVVDRSEGRGGGDEPRRPTREPSGGPSTGPSPSEPTDAPGDPSTPTPTPSEDPTTVPTEPAPTVPTPSAPATTLATPADPATAG